MPNDQRVSAHWPADSAAATTHVNLLQGIVNRLANNSSSCKTWCLTLVGVLVGLAGATHAPAIVQFALVPVVIFGYLDARYLAQERAYRKLYSTVVERIRTGQYGLADAYEVRAAISVGSVLSSLLSWSTWPVYLSLIVVYVIAQLSGWLAVLAATPR